jgi:hypothetical protein
VAVHTVPSSATLLSPQLDTPEIAREVEQIALECRRYLFPERQRITEPVKVAAEGGKMAEPDPTIPAEISNKFRRKTTVYSTKADKEVLAKLQSLTGLCSHS